jgi:hypothetical protein
MPDLTLIFVNPRLFDDVSFHPCVRIKKWEVCFIYMKNFFRKSKNLFRMIMFFHLFHLMAIFDWFRIILEHKSKFIQTFLNRNIWEVKDVSLTRIFKSFVDELCLEMGEVVLVPAGLGPRPNFFFWPERDRDQKWLVPLMSNCIIETIHQRWLSRKQILAREYLVPRWRRTDRFR